MKPYKFDSHEELLEQLTDQISEDTNLKDFFIKHDITYDTIQASLNELLVYQQEIKHCKDCAGLHECKQDILGHQPVLSYSNETIRLSYQACHYHIATEEKRQQQSRVNALYMPKMIYEASLSDFHMNTGIRKDLYHKMISFINTIKMGEQAKGIYLYGEYQAGKTYALAALANQCSAIGQSVIITYYPDLVREIKSSIKTGNLEARINELKHVDILMLDDIGGESQSPWVRDEVLGPILQHRLLDQKPTFFTSNHNIADLARTLADSKEQSELIKAYRIIERIKGLTEAFKL